jgi:exodeoxyribonuclease-3
MKIVTWNVNGLRSVYRSDFAAWLQNSGVDILSIQEVKAQDADITHLPLPEGYDLILHSAERKGYSGTACFVKRPPESVNVKIGHERFDSEGRMIELRYPDFTLFNFYIPNGARDKRDMAYKLDAYQHIFDYLRGKTSVILTGDFNIAHTPLDLARPKENQHNTMFTPEERIQIDHLSNFGYVDTFRLKYPEATGKYTWWPYFANARPRNIGWRIDYVFATKDLAAKIKDAFILDGVLGSDHCPAGIELA